MLDDALSTLQEHAHKQTDGIWLEDLANDVAPHIRDWNIDACWHWTEWPDREKVMGEETPSVDVGIDLVARRRDDRGWVAIQVKSRKLDEHGVGKAVTASEVDSFLAAASDKDVWVERWMLVNGAVSSGGHFSGKVGMSGAPMKVVNVAQAVEDQRDAMLSADTENDTCPHCDSTTEIGSDEVITQSRSCMQREAVKAAVERLRANETAEEHGIPRGEARGRIVLPCGVGKTRIALRIVEELTYHGELSVVLCPSIALVAQLRREFLQQSKVSIRALAVCSDKGVAKNDERIANSNDVTIDRGLTTTDHIKGIKVTTNAEEIAAWIRQRRTNQNAKQISVIFGTYQSARQIAEGIKGADAADGFKVMICDEAHRTAGVRKRKRSTAAEQRLREFTLCHDRDAFPATYRVYQTATPRIYGDQALASITATRKAKYVVRHMDDQSVFGVELYRRSYAEAVRNNWLSDYRIIAMGVGGKEATDIANELVRKADQKAERDAAKAATKQIKQPKPSKRRHHRLPSTGDYLKGMAFALAMGGAARTKTGERVPLQSCIGFLNTIARSQAMTDVLQFDPVRQWVAKQADDPVPSYRLEHLDASSSVTKRDEAKRRLAAADSEQPHAVLNVGIFGEGTDSPSLSAVAFLEPRKSPIDVVQAVGRAMRRAEGKTFGYIIVPVVIPEGEDAERHLAVSDKHEGWQELGEILQALRAHDKRIEDALPEMLTIQLPAETSSSQNLKTAVAVGRPDKTKLEYGVVIGTREHAEDVARDAVDQNRPLKDYKTVEPFTETNTQNPKDEPTSLIVHVERQDGSTDTRQDSVVRHKPKADQQQGAVNNKATKRRAADISKGKRGRKLPDRAERERQKKERDAKRQAQQVAHIQGVLVDLSDQLGHSIAMNLLEKSGLTGNKIQRDLNLLEGAVTEAARYLHQEPYLTTELDEHFGLDHLAAPKQGKPRADGATIASLLWMNTAMLHQRIHAGRWLSFSDIDSLSEIKASTEPEQLLNDSWNAITRQDFWPVILPALGALKTARRTRRLGGLRRALRHLVAEAEEIAETYADMGTDHAGALFNKVMGDQSSDGAFFTRPPAADITARLALEAIDPDNTLDWSNPNIWRDHKTVDLACGSGTLLTAVMTEMKRRAVIHDADSKQLAELQKVAVEETLKGLDINEVSLQLAATQLMAGNTDVKYQNMGLHQMPYGTQPDGRVAAGSPELFGSELLDAGRLFSDDTQSTRIETGSKHSETLKTLEIDKAVTAVSDARIVIMNPPFTNRIKMGQKFDKKTQQAIRKRMDTLEGFLADADPRLSEFLDKNSLQPRFAALADLCLNREKGVFATIIPTSALTAISALFQRQELAKRFHIHTILTGHQAADVNLSQNTSISETIVIMRRHNPETATSDTRIVSLDKIPVDATETTQLFDTLEQHKTGTLSDGWGEVSSWPAERIAAGDWSAAIWRSPTLADTAARFAKNTALRHLKSVGLTGHSAGQQFSNGYARCRTVGAPKSFPALYSKSAKAQQTIQATPDEHWQWQGTGPPPDTIKSRTLTHNSRPRLFCWKINSSSQHTQIRRQWMASGHRRNTTTSTSTSRVHQLHHRTNAAHETYRAKT